jgi:hypothetical protein
LDDLSREATVEVVVVLLVVLRSNWVSAFLALPPPPVAAVFSGEEGALLSTHGTETPLTYNFSDPLHCKAMFTSS